MQIDRDVLDEHEVTLELVEAHQKALSVELAKVLRSGPLDRVKFNEIMDALMGLDSIAFFVASEEEDEEYEAAEAQEAVQ